MNFRDEIYNGSQEDIMGYVYISGWWLTHPSEKYEFVSWDDDIPNIWRNKIHVPKHQPDMYQSHWI